MKTSETHAQFYNARIAIGLAGAGYVVEVGSAVSEKNFTPDRSALLHRECMC